MKLYNFIAAFAVLCQSDASSSEIEDLKALVKNLSSTVARMKNEYDMKILNLQLLHSKNSVPTNQTIAFYAYASQNQNLYPQQSLVFDYVETNIGNHYDSLTGKFTAPVRGLYFFAGNIMAVPGKFAHLEMVQNGRRVSSIFSAKGAIPYDDNTGNAVVNLLLNKGDQVWIRDENDPVGEGALTGTYAMFSGFLINHNV